MDDDGAETRVVFLLGYPGAGKRTIGSHLTELVDGVLVDNQAINIPLLIDTGDRMPPPHPTEA